MTQDNFGLALQNPQMLALILENKTQLDRKTRKKVEQFVNELLEQAERHNSTQDALSAIEAYTLYKADQTLTAGALLRMARHPGVSHAELDVFESTAKNLYLESSATAMAKTLRKVVDRLDT